MNRALDLSIIIINWNSTGYVQKCVASIQRETRSLRYEIIVVDSASYDGCGQMLAREFPGVRFIQSERNVGFARANNLGFEQSQGDCILFLNPDTELVGPAINLLHQALIKLEDAGIVGAKLLNTDGTLQTSCIQTFPTILNQILDAEILRRAFPRHSFWGMAPLFSGGENPVEVEVLCGACMMMPRAAFERVARFSEDYFMYSEDVDLCQKVEGVGMKNYYVPSAVLIHHGGGSSSKSSFSKLSNVMLRESRWRFFKKHKNLPYAIIYRICVGLTAFTRLGMIAVIVVGSIFVRRGALMRLAFRKWLSILMWALGLERWARRQTNKSTF
jgi:N-acetylglucosaminyl-diphospho-decaprenol L-rhamnosyltransferase